MVRMRGFTLVELVMFIVIVGVAVAGVVVVFTQATGNIHQPVLRQRTLAVANAYLDEILRKRWNENSPLEGGCVITGSASCPAGNPAAAPSGTDAGETRITYDDIDDYANTIIDQTPTDQSGALMAGYAGFRVTAAVTTPTVAWHGIPAADVREVRVSVTSPAGESSTLTAYRVNF